MQSQQDSLSSFCTEKAGEVLYLQLLLHCGLLSLRRQLPKVPPALVAGDPSDGMPATRAPGCALGYQSSAVGRGSRFYQRKWWTWRYSECGRLSTCLSQGFESSPRPASPAPGKAEVEALPQNLTALKI